MLAEQATLNSDADNRYCGSSNYQRDIGQWDSGNRILVSDHC